MFEYNGKKYYSGYRGAVKVTVANEFVDLSLSKLELDAARMAIGDQNQAETYVWGRQDEGNGERDTDIATMFGKAYAAHAMAYYVEANHVKINLRDFYATWIQEQTVSHGQ